MKTRAILRSLQKEDLLDVVKLHIKYLDTNLIDCKQSRNLLKLFYKSFIGSKQNISIVVDIDSTIVGYICVVKSLKELYLKMVMGNYLNFSLNLFGYLFNQKKSSGWRFV